MWEYVQGLDSVGENVSDMPVCVKWCKNSTEKLFIVENYFGYIIREKKKAVHKCEVTYQPFLLFLPLLVQHHIACIPLLFLPLPRMLPSLLMLRLHNNQGRIMVRHHTPRCRWHTLQQDRFQSYHAIIKLNKIKKIK